MSSFQESFEKLWESRDPDILAEVLWHEHDGLTGFLKQRLPADLQRAVSPEDILQEVFIAAFRAIGTLNPCDANAFRSWLYSIARAKSVDAIRRATAQKRDRRREVRQRKQMTDNGSIRILLSELVANLNTPSHEAATHEATIALGEAIESLPDHQRMAIQLRYIEELPLDEVAEKMARTQDSIRNLIFRAKQHLRTQLQRSSLWLDKR